MWPSLLIIIYCVLIVLASLLGGWLPSLMRLTHTRMQVIMSLVAGLMLGVALLHLLPHAHHFLEDSGGAGPLDWTVGGVLAGLLAMFFLIRIFQFHHHPPVETEGGAADHHHEDHDHSGHSHSHDHSHAHDYHPPSQKLSWLGLAFGLSLHTLIDGVALGAAVRAEASHGSSFSLFGLSIFLAIALHKPLDALSITSLMAARGWSYGRMQLVNAGFALMCPLGVVVFWFSLSQFGGLQSFVLGLALAFSAGVFLCISLGDLLPEVHFHRHDRLKLSLVLLLGVALAYGIEQLPGHSHGNHDPHEKAPPHEHHDDE